MRWATVVLLCIIAAGVWPYEEIDGSIMASDPVVVVPCNIEDSNIVPDLGNKDYEGYTPSIEEMVDPKNKMDI